MAAGPVAVAPAAAAVGGAPAPADFGCSACSESFRSADEQRIHCKSDRHVYNTKRRLAGLKPISQEAWEKKVRESLGTPGTTKGTAHLKAVKLPKKGSFGDGVEVEEPQENRQVQELAFSPQRSLFDKEHFESVEECLRYMQRTYDFWIHDQEYCTDLTGLLKHLWTKINEPPHACIYCNRKFPDASAVRRHMMDVRHTRIGTEARSRRGNPDEEGSQELQAEIEDFFDFTASTREVTEKIKDPEQRVSSIHRYFDADRDGRLCMKELARLWEATTKKELSEGQYAGACKLVGADPNKGLDKEALLALYAGGLADLEAHFDVFQDLLAKRIEERRRGVGQDDEEEDEDEEEGEDDEEEEEDDDEETEIVECEDEDEFEEVLRILGLQAATITENGDLRLPNGSVAGNRDMQHIWRQRGLRQSQMAVVPGKQSNVRRTRAQLMISSGAATDKLELSRREKAREGKKIIAVLKQQQKAEMKLGLQQNMLQRRLGLKFRSIFGDASFGR